MKLFKTCLAAAVACSLFYAVPKTVPQEAQEETVVSCVQTETQNILADSFTAPNTLRNMIASESKNILLLCTDESGMLYDSIFIIAHNKKANTVKVISLPRDLYVPYGEEIQSKLESLQLAQEKGIYKLNIAGFVGDKINYPTTVFSDRDVSFMADTIREMTQVSVSEYVVFDFQTFEKLVDTIGGITLTIPEDIRNADGELLISKGVQKLNGEKALLYARTRKFYDAEGNPTQTGGDFIRKENQLAIIQEILPQFVQNIGITKLSSLIRIMQKDVRQSFSTRDLYQYYKLIQNIAEGSTVLETYSLTGPEIQPLGDGCSYIEFK